MILGINIVICCLSLFAVLSISIVEFAPVSASVNTAIRPIQVLHICACVHNTQWWPFQYSVWLIWLPRRYFEYMLIRLSLLKLYLLHIWILDFFSLFATWTNDHSLINFLCMPYTKFNQRMVISSKAWPMQRNTHWVFLCMGHAFD